MEKCEAFLHVIRLSQMPSEGHTNIDSTPKIRVFWAFACFSNTGYLANSKFYFHNSKNLNVIGVL